MSFEVNMNPVDHTKTKRLIIDFSHRSIITDNIILVAQHAQKQGYLASDENPTQFGSTVTSYLSFNRDLMDRMNYGS
jgi:hypothetical protein